MDLNLDKIPSNKLFTYILILIALIIPGFGYLFLTKTEELFFRLDIIRLILLSIFYSTPLLITGIIYTLFQYDLKSKSEEDYYQKLMNQTSFFSLVSFFISTLAFFFIKNIWLFNDLIHLTYSVSVTLVIITFVKKICSPLN